MDQQVCLGEYVYCYSSWKYATKSSRVWAAVVVSPLEVSISLPLILAQGPNCNQMEDFCLCFSAEQRRRLLASETGGKEVIVWIIKRTLNLWSKGKWFSLPFISLLAISIFFPFSVLNSAFLKALQWKSMGECWFSILKKRNVRSVPSKKNGSLQSTAEPQINSKSRECTILARKFPPSFQITHLLLRKHNPRPCLTCLCSVTVFGLEVSVFT